jgi:hypothetical protein
MAGNADHVFLLQPSIASAIAYPAVPNGRATQAGMVADDSGGLQMPGRKAGFEA